MSSRPVAPPLTRRTGRTAKAKAATVSQHHGWATAMAAAASAAPASIAT